MTPLILLIEVVILVILGLACYCIGYAEAKAESKSKKHAIPQNDWRYDLEGTWNEYKPTEKLRHRVSHDAALDDTTIN